MPDRINILFVIDKLAPAGTQTNLLEIVRKLDRTRFLPFVVSLEEGGGLEAEFRDASAGTAVMGVRRVHGLSGIRAVFALRDFIRKNKIGGVQNFFLKAEIIGSLAAWLAGVRTVIASRRDEGFWLNPRQRKLRAFFSSRAAWVLANSEAVRKAAEQQERLRVPSRIIYNGVDHGNFFPDAEAGAAARREFGFSDADAVVGVIANMRHSIKGYPYLIQAAALVCRAMPHVRFLFVGDGSLRPSYEALADREGVRSRIVFAGIRRDTAAMINAMDIACLPSLTEGFSNALLEYMACGKPVVATAVGGNPEVVREGETGFLVPPADAKRLAEKILALSGDRGLCEKMGRAGREIILKGFTLPRMIAEYEAFYEGCLTAAPAAQGAGTSGAGRPARILSVIWSLDLGGAEQVVLNLARRIDRSRFEPVVCCLNEKGRFAGDLEALGIRVYALRKMPKFDPFLIFRLVSLIRREKIDLVHTHLFTGNLWGRLAAWLARVPVIATEHNTDVWKKGFEAFVDRMLAPVTARLVCVSTPVRDFYAARIPRLSGRMKIIYNGIDIWKFSQAAEPFFRTQAGIGQGEAVVGMAARLVPQKGYEIFIEALCLLRQKGVAVRALIAGEGPLRTELEDRIERAGLKGSVVFLGLVRDMPVFYRSIDVLALSSRREGFPIAILEAMAAGVPVVATDVGGVRECIDGPGCGVVVPPDDPQAFAGALAGLLEDKAGRDAIARNAREKVRRLHSLEKMTGDYEQLYGEVLSKGRSGA